MGRRFVLLVVIWLLLASPASAVAGMPSVTFSDIARLRLSAISFFVACFLLSAWGIQTIWNALQREFPALPRLTYKAASGVVFLWGLLFILVLTMISGARELMTPGAWVKQGLTYKLHADSQAPAMPEVPDLAGDRHRQLEKLRSELTRYAAHHAGRFPSRDELSTLSNDCWELPQRFGLRYQYVAGLTIDDSDAIVAYEPAVFDDDPLVLRVDGRIQRLNAGGLRQALDREARP